MDERATTRPRGRSTRAGAVAALIVRYRATPAERAAVVAAARARGLTLSDYIRDAVAVAIARAA